MNATAVALGFTLAMFVLRAIDLLVLRVDSWPDPTIVSKILGILLVLWYLRSCRLRIDSLGMHTRNLVYAVGVGGLSLLAISAALYAMEFHTLRSAGETPRIALGVIAPSSAMITGTAFLSVYFAGQILNAFAEESIFRGIVLPQFMRTMSFWKANLAQASLFGLAHLVWPLSSWVLGQSTPAQALAQAGMLLVFTTIGGLVFGYLYYRTNSIWAPLLAHLIDNCVGLFVHIETVTRFNAETDASIFARLGFLSLVLVVWFATKRARIAPLKPWVPGA